MQMKLVRRLNVFWLLIFKMRNRGKEKKKKSHRFRGAAYPANPKEVTSAL